MWSYLNKGISTPIAIGAILILAILMGSLTWWQYGEIWKEEVESPEVKIPEKIDYSLYNKEFNNCIYASFEIPGTGKEFKIRPKDGKGFICWEPEPYFECGNYYFECSPPVTDFDCESYKDDSGQYDSMGILSDLEDEGFDCSSMRSRPYAPYVYNPELLEEQFKILEEVSKAEELTADLEDKIKDEFVLLRISWIAGSERRDYVKLIYSENLNSQGIRIIGYEGSDIDPDNYFYKAVFLKDDKIISVDWPLFDEGDVADWAEEEFYKAIEESRTFDIVTPVKERNESSPIYQVVKEYDSIVKSIDLEKKEEDEFADWETYRNEEYGFEFKYPSDFQLSSIDPEPFEYSTIRYNYPHKDLFPIVNLDLKTDKYEGTGFGSAYFSVGVDLNEENLSECLLETDKVIADLQILEINNETFHRTTLFDDAMGGVRGRAYIYEVLHDNKCFVLHGFLSYRDSRGFAEEEDAVWLSKDDLEEILGSFDQIVSTFKFIEGSGDEYSFKPISYNNPNEKYPIYSLEIYKNQELVKTIKIENTTAKPSLFVLSPDKKHVTFKVAGTGGTCVYFGFPIVIDLDTFSGVDLDDSDMNKKIGDAFGMDFDEIIKFSAVQYIDDIEWVSNEKIRASMRFGDEICKISFYDKPTGSPDKIEAKVDFIIE